VRKPASHRTLKSDLAKVDRHAIRPHEYKELPELTDKALSRAVVNKGGRPRSANPRRLISIRLPVDVIERWKATGPGWQTANTYRRSPEQAALRSTRPNPVSPPRCAVGVACMRPWDVSVVTRVHLA